MSRLLKIKMNVYETIIILVLTHKNVFCNHCNLFSMSISKKNTIILCKNFSNKLLFFKFSYTFLALMVYLFSKSRSYYVEFTMRINSNSNNYFIIFKLQIIINTIDLSWKNYLLHVYASIIH